MDNEKIHTFAFKKVYVLDIDFNEINNKIVTILCNDNELFNLAVVEGLVNAHKYGLTPYM